MKFLWPAAFLLLVLPPLIIAIYFWMRRRRQRYAVRYSSLTLVQAAIPAQSRIRRYLPPALLLLALTILTVGMARPLAVTRVPAGRATIMLTIDVSSSMNQNDISPSRLEAAKKAAIAFIDRQKDSNQIGIVAFASFAQLIQPPSTDLEKLDKAILHLTTARGTAIGSGILIALDTIAEFNQNSADNTNGQKSATRTPTPKGEYEPDIVVLLTDGVSNAGPDPLESAQFAVDNGIRVYTIGYGTSTGAVEQGNGFFRGGGFNRGIDEETLKTIARLTGGEYYSASSASELQKVFDSLPTALITREETWEISVLFVALGAVLVITAVLLSQLWHPLP
jgi:Ca-activated chloride channel family protein